MKRKLLLMTAILAIIGGCFVGCNNDRDDDMTTKPSESISDRDNMDRDDNDGTNLSEGLSSGVSEVSSDVGQGITNVSEKINEGVSNISENVKDAME